MISNKYITPIVVLLTAMVFLFFVAGSLFPDLFSSVINHKTYDMEYQEELFDTDKIIDVNIIMDEDSWNDMLNNAIKEEYYKCDVTINGKTFYSVGIRPKGNTSLSSIVNDPDNDRYSFKLEFDQYADGQTCFGLDKLVLNNSFADATNMKEALIYDMFQYLEADASLYNYAKISVNDKYWGIYLALEAVEDSFMLRNYGTENGKLYKPDSMEFGGNGDERGERKPPENMNGAFPAEFDGEPPNMDIGLEQAKAEGTTAENVEKFKEKLDRFPGKNNDGSNLNYSDDALTSYSAIWEGSVNGSTNADHRKVVTALKHISEGTELATYMNVDNLLKYMAVHSFAVNDDSLSGNMAHNYYLYESNGKLNIIPWDYNLSFGGMSSGNAEAVINDPIDTPFSGTNFFDGLLENDEYKSKYHAYYRQLVEEYIYGGRFDETYSRIREQIDSLVETDPNAMYSYDEYTAAAQMLYDTVLRRAESVKGQLDGTVPSTSDGQKNNPEALVDASDLDLSVMGSMMGEGRGGFGMRIPSEQPNPEEWNANQKEDMTEERSGDPGSKQMRPDNMNVPDRILQQQTDTQEEFSLQSFIKNYQTLIVSILLLILAFVFIKVYKRKNY